MYLNAVLIILCSQQPCTSYSTSLHYSRLQYTCTCLCTCITKCVSSQNNPLGMSLVLCILWYVPCIRRCVCKLCSAISSISSTLVCIHTYNNNFAHTGMYRHTNKGCVMSACISQGSLKTQCYASVHFDFFWRMLVVCIYTTF